MKKLLICIFAILFANNLWAGGIDANAISATCDNATLETYSGTVGLEVNWIPNDINVRYYNGDTQLSAPATCSYGGDLILPTPPSRTGYNFVGWELKIPNDYTRLQYIESTGTQYINTGVGVDDHNSFELSLAIINDNNIGSLYDYILSQGHNSLRRTDNRISWFSANYNYHYTVEKFKFYKFNFGYNYMSVDNSPISGNPDTDNATGNNVTIFAINSSYDDNCVARIEYIKIWDNQNNLVRNFIPARRNSDNVLGMYDTVTGTFFTNSGTGTFIAGPDVQ